MRKVLYLLLGLAVYTDTSLGWNQFVDFGSCYNVYNVNDDHTYEMSWNGNDHFAGCRVTFHGYDSDQPLDQYKVCIKATIWDITDRNVKLQYYSGSTVLSNYLAKDYSRFSGDPTIRWCSFTDDYVDIKLTTSQSIQNQGRITLSVTAERTYTYYNYGVTVGGAVGGVVFITFCVIFISIACRRRVYAQRLTTTASPTTTVITQSGSQQMQAGVANPGYTTGPAAPPPYYPPNNQYANYPGQPPQYPGTQGPQTYPQQNQQKY